jgi:glycosyltransferase involved in cell wall biosynthesis
MNTLALSAGQTVVRDNLPRSTMHVVHGVLSLELGGLERLVLDLAREGIRRGQQVSIVCIERPGRLARDAEALGAEVHSIDKPPGKSLDAVARSAALLGRLAPDVIHTHQVGALWYLGQAARRSGHLPVIHTEHTDHVSHARRWTEKLRARFLWMRAAPLAERFCCVSPDIARSVRAWRTVPRSKVDVVQNGIDVDMFADGQSPAAVRLPMGIPAGALVIGTVGRLVEVKQQNRLIEAYAALRSRGRHANTWLLIVGDGPERQNLEKLACELGVADRTVFTGYCPKPQKLLRAMDLFALTSRHEGLPLALLEAWASGLPVVSTSVGAIPQTVIHGINGMLYRSGDQRALVQTLDMLLESPWLMSQLARRGQERARLRYSLTRMADEYEQRYRTLATTY